MAQLELLLPAMARLVASADLQCPADGRRAAPATHGRPPISPEWLDTCSEPQMRRCVLAISAALRGTEPPTTSWRHRLTPQNPAGIETRCRPAIAGVAPGAVAGLNAVAAERCALVR